MADTSKILVVVESPSKAKTIQKYLGEDYIVRASYGHIIDLPSGKLGVDVENNFQPKYIVLHDKKDKLKAILDVARYAKVILLASDPDREGEAIAWHLKQELEKFNVPIKRILLKEITKEGIKKAIQNPQDLDKNLYDAQQARRILDRIVGYTVSPYLIRTFNSTLSAGRVQSVAIRMVVDREREIEEFKPEEYWNISAFLASEDEQSSSFSAKYQGKIQNEDLAQKLKENLLNCSYVISDLEEKEKKKNPNPPLITSSLATAAAGRYKFPAKKTMAAAQALYETGLITYMRTDSTRVSPEAVTSCREWLKAHGHDIPASPNQFKTKGSAQDAHEAIRPTDITRLPQNAFLPEDQQKIYGIIWERFVASQMNPAIFDTVTATIKTSDGHILKASGKVLKYKGWLEILEDFDKEDDGNEAKLPPLRKNQTLTLVKPKVKLDHKFTQPPPRYSEKSLIIELEKKGIGRPSTYASIMSKITDRNYVTRKNDVFYATETGKKVVDILSNKFDFMEYQYTAGMEEKLDLIAEGKLEYVGMLSEFYSPFQDQLKKAYAAQHVDHGYKCESCEIPLRLVTGRFGHFLGCPNYPNCKYSLQCDVVDGKPVAKEKKREVVEDVSCPQCHSSMIEKMGVYGPFYSCLSYPKCRGTKKVEVDKPCSRCGSVLYYLAVNKVLKLSCTNYPSCTNIEDLPDGLDIEWNAPKPRKIASMLKKVLKTHNLES